MSPLFWLLFLLMLHLKASEEWPLGALKQSLCLTPFPICPPDLLKLFWFPWFQHKVIAFFERREILVGCFYCFHWNVSSNAHIGVMRVRPSSFSLKTKPPRVKILLSPFWSSLRSKLRRSILASGIFPRFAGFVFTCSQTISLLQWSCFSDMSNASSMLFAFSFNNQPASLFWLLWYLTKGNCPTCHVPSVSPEPLSSTGTQHPCKLLKWVKTQESDCRVGHCPGQPKKIHENIVSVRFAVPANNNLKPKMSNMIIIGNFLVFVCFW